MSQPLVLRSIDAAVFAIDCARRGMDDDEIMRQVEERYPPIQDLVAFDLLRGACVDIPGEGVDAEVSMTDEGELYMEEHDDDRFDPDYDWSGQHHIGGDDEDDLPFQFTPEGGGNPLSTTNMIMRKYRIRIQYRLEDIADYLHEEHIYPWLDKILLKVAAFVAP